MDYAGLERRGDRRQGRLLVLLGDGLRLLLQLGSFGNWPEARVSPSIPGPPAQWMTNSDLISATRNPFRQLPTDRLVSGPYSFQIPPTRIPGLGLRRQGIGVVRRRLYGENPVHTFLEFRLRGAGVRAEVLPRG